MMKGKTIVDTEKLQEFWKLLGALESSLWEAEKATKRGKFMACQLNEKLEDARTDCEKLCSWNENEIRSGIVADYAHKAMLSMKELWDRYDDIFKSFGSIANSEHDNI